MRLQLLLYYLNCEVDEEGDKSFAFKKKHGSWFGKPGFPECTDSYDISDYMGPDSIGFFTFWEELESYQAALKAVKHLKVVNDAAERGGEVNSRFYGCSEERGEVPEDTPDGGK